MMKPAVMPSDRFKVIRKRMPGLIMVQDKKG
jgi:hypothetical protein